MQALNQIEPAKRILELGSGPGFLANKLLSESAQLRMTLLDFSDATHSLARKRLGALVNRVEFLARSFKASDWYEGLNAFDAVVTNQAVHELRHKQRGSIAPASGGGLTAGRCAPDELSKKLAASLEFRSKSG